MSSLGTPGGNRIKALREFVGKTQLEVELDASLGMGYLQRVESGKVRHPERETVERILAALGARYTERRSVLEMFGYLTDAPLPDADDIRWAVEVYQAELNNAVFPLYLLDCSHRLLAWNAFIPKMFRLPRHSDGQYLSILKLIFDATYKIMPRIANPAEFFPAQIRAFRYEMHPYSSEAWYQTLIADMRRYPLFEQHWTQTPQTYYTAARPLVPIELDVPDVGLLQFRLVAEPFAQDRRFRVIYYLPAEPKTVQQCINWLQP